MSRSHRWWEMNCPHPWVFLAIFLQNLWRYWVYHSVGLCFFNNVGKAFYIHLYYWALPSSSLLFSTENIWYLQQNVFHDWKEWSPNDGISDVLSKSRVSQSLLGNPPSSPHQRQQEESYWSVTPKTTTKNTCVKKAFWRQIYLREILVFSLWFLF